ncbi:hypothetical protein DFH07DRAFT_950466 [Mycena maculata]|uniref:DUF6533 domain-containing protein n=1 Tax=Mycena maculata TaxID=230809 RepID=A0AAD7K6I8_9AGAR|nr:hypothetical protein DFH07DRAFT_950466 [Mycena maculata]
MATVELGPITVTEDTRLRRYAFLAAFVVLVYDHLLTLKDEVTYMWTPKLKRSTAWFLLVRYVALLGNLALVPYFVADVSAELKLFLEANFFSIETENYLLVVQETFIELTLAVRVCAMYGFNRRVFAALSVAAVITFSLGAWAVVGTATTLITTIPGCHIITLREQALRESIIIFSVAGAWEAQLSCDILIIGLTLRRAYTYNKAVGSASRGSLLKTMVPRILCLVNLANILMIYYGDIVTAGSLAWFASTISVTLISRLMLNLHVAANGNWTTATMNTRDREAGLISFRRRTDFPDTLGDEYFYSGAREI